MNDATVSEIRQPEAGPSPIPRDTSRLTIAAWLGMAFLVVLQYGLFRQHALREVVWAHPTKHDQVAYLAASYETYERILTEGVGPGVRKGLNLPVDTSVLLHVQGGLLYLVLGPSRLSALTLNFIYFALLEMTLLATLYWYARRWSLAFLGIGLLLAAATPFFWAGGMMDFRIDFAAFCLFGIFLCAVVRSRMFQSWPWSAAAGAAATLLVLDRFVALAYVVGVLGAILALLCLQGWFRRRDGAARRVVVHQVAGLVIAAAIVAAVAAPVLWRKLPMIRSHYITHVESSDNQFQIQLSGTSRITDRLLFYPRSLLRDHAGWSFLELSGLCLVAALTLGRLRRRVDQQSGGSAPRPDVASLACAGIFLCVPLSILTLYNSPSPVVGGITVVPLVWVVLWMVYRLLGERWNESAGKGLVALSATAVLWGFCTQANALGKRTVLGANRAEYEEVVQLFDQIATLCQENGWKSPRVGTNTISEHCHAGNIMPLAYERLGIFLSPRTFFPVDVGPVSEEQAVAAVKQSDIFILTGDGPSLGLDVYPVVRSLRELRPKMRAACEQTHFLVKRFHLLGEEVLLYARPHVRLSGETTDGWVTSDGLTVKAPNRYLRARPRIELAGSTNFDLLGRVPAVRAQVVTARGASVTVPASLVTDGPRYQIRVEPKPEDISEDAYTEIRLFFDAYFVPSDQAPYLGPNDDSRRLVIRAPDDARLLAQP